MADMLAVLDAKLAARDDPNNARSRPRPRFERARKLEPTCAQARTAFASFFHRCCLVARKLRCASCTSFYSVLLGSNEVSTTRAREARKLENGGVSASKNGPEAVQDTPKPSPSGKNERQKRSKCEFFLARATGGLFGVGRSEVRAHVGPV